VQEGAFALLDFLGFKGIWERVGNPDDVVKKFREMEKQIPERIASRIATLKSLPTLKVATAFLSDTITIAIYLENQRPPDDLSKGTLVLAVSIAAQMVADSFCRDPIPLLLRGCITYGEFIIDGTLILGPAVDEAAGLHQMGEGAFIWVAPSTERVRAVSWKYLSEMMQNPEKRTTDVALAHLRKMVPESQSGVFEQNKEKFERISAKLISHAGKSEYGGIAFYIENYPMPVKGGRTLSATLVVPFSDSNDIENVIRQYEKGMAGDRLDIVLKRQTTLGYLHHIRDIVKQRNAEFAAITSDLVKSEFTHNEGKK
jgi:hypothetical protein